MRLKGKRLDHWGEGLAARYDEAREDDWKADLRRRVEHLDGLPDDVFADLLTAVVQNMVAVGAVTGLVGALNKLCEAT